MGRPGELFHQHTTPLLSCSPQEEQLRAHEAWLAQAAAELGELQRSLPEPRSRSRGLDDYRLRKDYLLYEVTP